MSQLAGPPSSVMLVGEVGTGKTYCGKTFLDCGVTPFYIFTDPGMSVVAEFAGEPPDCKIHWQYVPPARTSWVAQQELARKINTLSFKALTEVRGSGDEYQQWIKFYTACANFTCDRCGQEFGPIDDFGSDRAVIVDNLSTISKMSMDNVKKGKPVASMGEWGIAMDNLENWVLAFSTGMKCWSVLIAHLEREQDEVTGSVRLMASTLGRRLSPRLPRTFGEVVQCVQEGKEFFWRTESVNVALKERLLPLADRIPPDFCLLVSEWTKRGGVIQPAMAQPVTVGAN